MLGSIFFRREDEEELGSVDCLGKALELREGLGLASALPIAPVPAPVPGPSGALGDAGRAGFLVGDLVGDLDCEGLRGDDLIGEGGSDGFEEKKSSSSKSGSSGLRLWVWWCFLDDFLEKNFIELSPVRVRIKSRLEWRSLGRYYCSEADRLVHLAQYCGRQIAAPRRPVLMING